MPHQRSLSIRSTESKTFIWEQNQFLISMLEHCRDNNVNGAIYTTVISTNQNKSTLTCQHSFIGKRCFAACFDLNEVIISRHYKNSILVLELCFVNMDQYYPSYYNLFHFDSEYYPFLNII
jgi:hypothetical protein